MSWRGMVSAVVVVGVLATLTGAVWALRSGEDAPSDALVETPVDYVALGDSYSAGPLIPVVREDAPGCFRSTNNYPAYLAGLLDVDSYADATCSGASTRDVTRRQPSMLGGTRPRPQAAALSERTDLVTVGLGGNDFGLFGSISGGCREGFSWRSASAPCRDAFVDATGRDTKARDARRIRGTLRAALEEVRDRAPDADVYVVGYPRLLPETGSCAAAGFTAGDAAWARGIEALLNRSVRTAAEDVGATYVDLYPASRGHDICAGRDAWVNGRRLRLGVALSYHPFEVGMREAARVVYAAVTGEEAPAVEGGAAPPAEAVVPSG